MTEKNNDHSKLVRKVRSLSDLPGVYLFLDKDGRVIYVGKAKKLRRRVISYFVRNVSGKTRVLVSKIAEIRHVVVDTESDALLLENNLIKKYQPRYNILLKDDKSYPWICIKKEFFPRVFMTRNIIKDGSEYFGPYTSAQMVRTLLDLIRQLYPLRTCNLKLMTKSIKEGKFKVCLEYHLGNCKAPCIGAQTEEDYDRNIDSIRHILKGNIREVTRHLVQLMNNYAAEYQYEKAQIIKEKLKILEKFQGRTVIVNPKITNVDVFSLVEKQNYAVVNFLKIIKGAVIQSHTIEVKKVLNESKEDILPLIVSDIRQRFSSDACEIIVPFRPEIEISGTKWTIPQRGDRKKLLKLSERNAKYYMLEKEKRKEKFTEKYNTVKKLENLKKDLRLTQTPVHIECFDNSNLQGTTPVASCVVFRDGKPSKKEYRHFNIKTVTGPNDFASMEEIIYRRYRHLLDEESELPQLVVIDGGKGQMNAALKSLEVLGLQNRIAVIGIAKRLEEIYFPHDPVPLFLDKNSESLKLIQRLRDEAHRFGITFHRNKRSKAWLSSELEAIPGIGQATLYQLYDAFSSFEDIRSASLEQLAKVIGKVRAAKVYGYYHRKEPDINKESDT